MKRKPILCLSCDGELNTAQVPGYYCPTCRIHLGQNLVRAGLMIITNLEHIHGHRVVQILGLAGGTNQPTGFTSNTVEAGDMASAANDMAVSAHLMGANAILGVTFFSSGSVKIGFSCYGTAARVELAPEQTGQD